MRWHQCTANATICKFRCFMNISNAALQNGTLDSTAEVPEGERWEVGGGGVAFNAIKQQDAVTSGTLAHLNWELIPSTKNIKSLHIQSKDEVDDVKCILL